MDFINKVYNEKYSHIDYTQYIQNVSYITSSFIGQGCYGFVRTCDVGMQTSCLLCYNGVIDRLSDYVFNYIFGEKGNGNVAYSEWVLSTIIDLQFKQDFTFDDKVNSLGWGILQLMYSIVIINILKTKIPATPLSLNQYNQLLAFFTEELQLKDVNRENMYYQSYNQSSTFPENQSTIFVKLILYDILVLEWDSYKENPDRLVFNHFMKSYGYKNNKVPFCSFQPYDRPAFERFCNALMAFNLNLTN